MTTFQLAPIEARSHRDKESTARPPRAAWKPRTVVAGFDGSPAASRAVERAAALMDPSGLLILVTVEPAVYSRGVLSESLLESDEDLASESLRQGRARLRDAEVAQLTLGDFAARALLGSVATQVVANAPCDVLVVS